MNKFILRRILSNDLLKNVLSQIVRVNHTGYNKSLVNKYALAAMAPAIHHTLQKQQDKKLTATQTFTEDQHDLVNNITEVTEDPISLKLHKPMLWASLEQKSLEEGTLLKFKSDDNSSNSKHLLSQKIEQSPSIEILNTDNIRNSVQIQILAEKDERIEINNKSSDDFSIKENSVLSDSQNEIENEIEIDILSNIDERRLFDSFISENEKNEMQNTKKLLLLSAVKKSKSHSSIASFVKILDLLDSDDHLNEDVNKSLDAIEIPKQIKKSSEKNGILVLKKSAFDQGEGSDGENLFFPVASISSDQPKGKIFEYNSAGYNGSINGASENSSRHKIIKSESSAIEEALQSPQTSEIIKNYPQPKQSLFKPKSQAKESISIEDKSFLVLSSSPQTIDLYDGVSLQINQELKSNESSQINNEPSEKSPKNLYDAANNIKMLDNLPNVIKVLDYDNIPLEVSIYIEEEYFSEILPEANEIVNKDDYSKVLKDEKFPEKVMNILQNKIKKIFCNSMDQDSQQYEEESIFLSGESYNSEVVD